MSRKFDHKKQYACTEVFRLEELQELTITIEELNDDYNIPVLDDAIETINDFIKNLEEQEKQK